MREMIYKISIIFLPVTYFTIFIYEAQIAIGITFIIVLFKQFLGMLDNYKTQEIRVIFDVELFIAIICASIKLIKFIFCRG